MLQDIEQGLTLLVSLMGAVTALLTAVAQLRRLRQPPDDEAGIAELEKDIVRLENALRQQQAEIVHLKQQRENT